MMQNASQCLAQEAVTSERMRMKRRRKRRRVLFICCMLAWPVLHFLVFSIYVNINSAFMCFRGYNYTTMQEEWVGFANFRMLYNEVVQGSLANNIVTVSVRNSFLYFFLNTLVLFPLSVLSSFFFFKKMPGHKIFRVAFFLPSLIPGLVMTMLYGFMLDSTFGVVNHLLTNIGLGHLIPENGWFGSGGVAQAMIMLFVLWSGAGANIILLSGALGRIPTDVFESARLDGVSMMGELFHLVLPLIWPTVSIMIVSACMTIFSVYMPPMILTQGGPNGQTMTIAYLIMNWTTGGVEYLGATAGVIVSCFGVPFVLLVKWLMEKAAPAIEY